jgi:branched-chain amino acid aminotransferase
MGGGNSAARLAAQTEATRDGGDQVVVLDAVEKRWVEELGGMNIFFVFEDGSIQTPPLTGTILPGITRDSLIVLARDHGSPGRADPPTRAPGHADAASGRLTEAFACGTAAVVTPIGTVKGKGFENKIGTGDAGPVTTRLKTALLDIQNGRAEDKHGWIHRVF